MFLQFIWKSLQWNWTLHLIKGKPANFNFKAIGSAQIFVQFIIIRKCLQWHWKRIRAYYRGKYFTSKPLQMCKYLYSLFLENVYSDRFSPLEKDHIIRQCLQWHWKSIRACVEECRRLILFPWLPQAPLIGNYYPQFSILNENIIIPNDDYDDSQWKDDCRKHL